jgi:ribosomal protein S10
MNIFNLTLKSKNRDSLEKFYQFFNRNTFRNLKIIKKYFLKKSTKKVITILKSPHVNKIAQEQFELRVFSMQYKIRTTQTLKLLMFIKIIKANLFPEVSIKLQKASADAFKHKTLHKFFFNTDSYKQKRLKSTKSNSRVKSAACKTHFLLDKNFFSSKILLKLLDTYGR